MVLFLVGGPHCARVLWLSDLPARGRLSASLMNGHAVSPRAGQTKAGSPPSCQGECPLDVRHSYFISWHWVVIFITAPSSSGTGIGVSQLLHPPFSPRLFLKLPFKYERTFLLLVWLRENLPEWNLFDKWVLLAFSCFSFFATDGSPADQDTVQVM